MHHLRANRIENDVACQFQQVAVFLDDDTFVTALKYVPYAFMAAVDRLRVHAVKLAHAQGEIAFDCFNHDVVVIRHLAPGVAHPIEASANLAERLKPCTPISVIEINVLAPVTTRSDVVQASSQFDP